MRGALTGIGVLGLLVLLRGCYNGGGVVSLFPDQGIPDLPADQQTVGLFGDCTPEGGGFSDVVCAPELRCGLVQIFDGSYAGMVSQCVPRAAPPLAEDAPCALDQEVAPPVSSVRKRFDRCAPGLGCVPVPTGGMQCKRLCELRKRAGCAGRPNQLCVLPAAVSGLGYCAAADACAPVFPQTGCPRAGGQILGCYVLTDDKGGGTFCQPQQPYGDSAGAIDTPCERSSNCQSGLGCFILSGRDSTCRPYCALPAVPDGGTLPDGGAAVQCSGMLGQCRPISGYEEFGRCSP